MRARIRIGGDDVYLLALGIEHMRSTSHARVEGTDDLDNLERLVRNLDLRVHHSHLIGAVAGLVITRASAPGRRNDALVVVRLAILDGDVVGQCAARSLVDADALALFRPGRRIPFLVGSDFRIAGLDVGDELVEEVLVDLG